MEKYRNPRATEGESIYLFETSRRSEVLHLFEAIRNSRWLLWTLIEQDILISSPELLHGKSADLPEMFL